MPKSRKGLASRLEGSGFIVEDSLDIEMGWLLPGGFGIDLGMRDHCEAAEVLGMENVELMEAGWIRKVDNYNYQLDLERRDSVAELNSHLCHVASRRNTLKTVFIDNQYAAFNGRKAYNFTLDDFTHECMDLPAILRDSRYVIHQ